MTIDDLERLARAALEAIYWDHARCVNDLRDALTEERILALLAVVRAAKEYRSPNTCLLTATEVGERQWNLDAALAKLEQV